MLGRGHLRRPWQAALPQGQDYRLLTCNIARPKTQWAERRYPQLSMINRYLAEIKEKFLQDVFPWVRIIRRRSAGNGDSQRHETPEIVA
jgi:hypothetical protein